MKGDRRSITLLGLSNPDKDRLARELAGELGGTLFRGQRELNALLVPLLRHEGCEGLGDLARWFTESADNEQRYLRCERLVMEEALQKLAAEGGSLVIDATPSVVHIEEAHGIRDVLQEQTVIVLLETTDHELDHAAARFAEVPEPVVWAGYNEDQNDGESQTERLARCCRTLLNARLTEYRRWMHHFISPKFYRDPDFTAVDVLKLIGMLE